MITKYKERVVPVNVCGEDCITIGEFAKLTLKSESSIRQLINKGNILRKLETVYAGNKPFIPVRELYDFPFVANGRPYKTGYIVTKYKLQGESVEAYETFIKNPKYSEGKNE